MTAERFDDHDHGFTLQQDLRAIERRLHDRRRMLEWMLSGATAAVIAACGGGSGGSSSSTTSTSSGSSSSDGEYSLYATDLLSENYLRGVQVTDGNGQVTFQTIFPACYSGRYPHIHVEVYKSAALATGQANAILTTQLAMPRDICSTVYSGATGYSASVTNLAAVTTASDGVFDTSTTAELSAQTPALTGTVASGYTGTVTIGVAV